VSKSQCYTSISHRNRIYTIHYWIRKGTGNTLLYLHGLGNTKQDFKGAISREDLKSYTLVAFDFPGCGDSTYHDEIPLGIDDLVSITHKFTEQLQLKDIFLIGQSLGGLTGLQYALTYPRNLQGFINVEGNLHASDCDVQSRDVFRYPFLGHEKTFMERVIHRLLISNKPHFATFGSQLRNNINLRTYFDYSRSLVDYSDHFPLVHQFATLPLPKHYIYGENSTITYLSLLREAGISVTPIPNSDHFPTQSNPEAFYNAVIAFIALC